MSAVAALQWQAYARVTVPLDPRCHRVTGPIIKAILRGAANATSPAPSEG
jgi:hypothetical protein